MNVECYLIVSKSRGKEARVVRVTQGKPNLQSNEAVIRLQLELPSDTFDAPLITVPIERRQVAVAIEVDEPL